MTLLEIVQAAASEIGLPEPTTAFGSTDQQIISLHSLANREGKSLAHRHMWERLVKRGSHTTIAAQNQGVMTTLFSGFASLTNQTLWNDTQQRPIPGAVPPIDRALLQSAVTTGPYQSYWIQGGDLHLYPAPAAGETITCEYRSKNWVLDDDASTEKSAFDGDSDTPLLDPELITMGVIWRFKRARGLDYAEEFTEYERYLADAIARDGGKPVIDSSTGNTPTVPALYVPEGSYLV